MEPPVPTLGGLLAAARRRAFVGRSAELELFAAALEPDPPCALLFIHGPGGIGKTTLLQRYADLARAAGRPTVSVDGRGLRADRDAFLAAVGAALGLPRDSGPLPTLWDHTPPVLLIDTYETLEIDRWLREWFLPLLPARSLVVIAGRQPPATAWREDSGWESLMQVVPLNGLTDADARDFLRARGVAAERHDDVLRLAGGYPLALALLADVVAQSGAVPAMVSDAPDVVQALLSRFVDDAPTQAHRDALSVCAIVKTVTEPLLRTTVREADASDLMTWLRGLSFVEARSEGLVVHDLARDVLTADLRWRDAGRYRRLRTRAGRYYGPLMTGPDVSIQENALGEATFLQRNHPLFGPYWSWQDADAVGTRPLDQSEVDVLAAMAADLEGPTASRLVRYWAQRQPQGFLVFRRSADPVPSGFALFLTLSEPSDADLAADPVLAAAWRFVTRQAPPRPGEHVFVGRFLVSREGHGRPGPEMNIVFTRSTLGWLRDRRLAWSLVTAPAGDHQFWEPLYHYVDLIRIDDPPACVDGKSWVLYGHDWRATPADDYLALLHAHSMDESLDLAALAVRRQSNYAVLSQEAFRDAVRAALRSARSAEALAANPLAATRMAAAVSAADAGAAVVSLLEAAVDSLRGTGGGEKLHRALATTYFKGAPTQEAAAERLGLPFSTYRRHLSAGTEHVIAWLWDREIGRKPDS